jgi:hypothetical protein
MECHAANAKQVTFCLHVSPITDEVACSPLVIETPNKLTLIAVRALDFQECRQERVTLGVQVMTIGGVSGIVVDVANKRLQEGVWHTLIN